MKVHFLNLIQKVLENAESIAFERVDEYILWIGTTDKELNRTIDLSIGDSMRIQIGSSITYFEGTEANEEQVIRAYIQYLSKEIIETQFYSRKRILKTRYQIAGANATQEIGLSSSILSIIAKEDSTKSILHPPILNEAQCRYLETELKKLYTDF